MRKLLSVTQDGRLQGSSGTSLPQEEEEEEETTASRRLAHTVAMVTVLHLCHESLIAVYGQGYVQGHGQAAASSLRIGLLVVPYRIPSKHLGFHCYSSSREDPYPAYSFV